MLDFLKSGLFNKFHTNKVSTVVTADGARRGNGGTVIYKAAVKAHPFGFDVRNEKLVLL